jgi:glutathione S-transferase
LPFAAGSGTATLAGMRQITHLLFSPASRLSRLLIGEKRLICDHVPAEDVAAHLPVFIDADGTRCEGLWAVVDHLEGVYPENPQFPEDAEMRGETLRWLDWCMGDFSERATRRIVFEKANPRFTGAPSRSTPDMNVIRKGRDGLAKAMAELGRLIEERGYLAGKVCTIADLALAANLSALDYFGEVKWNEFPLMREWYMRVKSRPSFRSLLADRAPGQPPVSQYAELDF